MTTNNVLNKTLILYKISFLVNTFKNIFILISVCNGWLILPVNNNKNKKLESILFGFNRVYKFFFKIRGFGFKWKYAYSLKNFDNKIFLKVGFTHRISLIAKNNSKCILKKRRFILKNRSYSYIRNNFNFLFFLYQFSLYNKRGIYLRGTKFKLKLSKKKSKF